MTGERIMKKIDSYFWKGMLAIVLVFSFVSCTVDEIVPSQTISKLNFNIQVNNASAVATKAVKTTWENGDKVYVFFARNNGSEKVHLDAAGYVTLTFNGTTWEGAPSSSLNVIELGEDGTMYGVYFPFGGVTPVSDGAGGVKFLSSGNPNPALDGLPVYSFFMNGNAAYTVATVGDVATLSGSLNLTIPEGFVWFFINKEGTTKYLENAKYRLAVQSVEPVACSSFKNGSFGRTTLLKGQPLWGYNYKNEGMAFSGMIENKWTTDQTHKFVLFADGVPAVTKSFSGVKLTNYDTVNLSMASGWSQAVSAPTLTEFNGLKWGNWNLGATAVDEIGLYLQWGGLIEPEENPSNHYRDYGDGSFAPMKEILGNNDLVGNYAIYDAARAYLGEGWRMPTKTELYAIVGSDDDWKIVSAGNMTEEVGPVYNTNPAEYLIPTAKSGAKFMKNSSSIFLPISGVWQAANNTHPSNDDNKGCYWSSTTKDATDAYYFDFYLSKTKSTSFQYKAQGRQIRPIYDPH